MHVLIIGGAGMIGRKLAERLSAEGKVGSQEVSTLTLVDVVPPVKPTGFKGEAKLLTADLSAPGEAEKLIASRPDMIFHLAAVVSGEAEADFEKGYRINLDGTRYLFEAVRKEGLKQPYNPRLVFTSSIAVFGAPFPEKIGDEYFLTPLTSYGTQKAIGELLLSDYNRRGFFQGIGIRLPTICIRPGAPNKAASGFFSNILREPLSGQEAILPVPEDVRHWFASPRAAIGFMMHAATMDLTKLGARRNLNMPGLSATVGEELAALKKAGGDKALKLVRRESDPIIMRIVEGWPRNFEARRAVELGFRADADFDTIVRVHIEDELGEAA